MSKNIIGVIGLGYVGLPLAIQLSKKYTTIGYDIDLKRINELNNFEDSTLEVDKIDLIQNIFNSKNKNLKNGLFVTSTISDLKKCNFYIITVPTPIDKFKKPDLTPLLSASKSVGKLIDINDIVIYESTVFPGCTEEICVPVLEKYSELKFNLDFFCGYSPERINPGDKINKLVNIKKVTSGSNKISAKKIDNLYNSIIKAGTHLASSIKVAEAAKVIENAQRDVNISFVNELALIFDRLEIDTHEVLDAASTKWNFLNFKPGLVGGHCISVDPYYLTYKSEQLGYSPEVILSGRRVNDNMGKFVASKLIQLMLEKNINLNISKILILGFTFKENCPDTRNTKVIDIYSELLLFKAEVDIYDPFADKKQVFEKYNIRLLKETELKKYHGIILAVKHNDFLNINYSKILYENGVLFDTKGFLPKKYITKRL